MNFLNDCTKMFGIESLKGADDIYTTVMRIPKSLFTRPSCK